MPTTKPQLAQSIRTTSESLILSLDGKEFSILWNQCSPRLAQANEHERLQAELSPGGYGIHWPLIDEDLTVTGLLSKLDS